jgi:TRAP-type C4-dicarboxylate transport system permease small subunit
VPADLLPARTHIKKRGDKTLKTLEKICSVLDKIASAVTVALLVFLTILITYSVISRFVFNTPVAWQYVATLVCLSWVVFIGMSVTFRNDEHMRLTFVSNAMPKKMQNIWLAVMDAFVFVFLVVAAYLSISIIKNAMPTQYQTIPVSRGLFYMPFPIGCILSLFHIVNTNVRRINGLPVGPANYDEAKE